MALPGGDVCPDKQAAVRGPLLPIGLLLQTLGLAVEVRRRFA
jgi:hypothetical protein